jgi:integrase
VKTVLTDRAIKGMRVAAKAYDVHDAIVPGLSLNVLPSGLKRFVLLTRFPGARHPTRRALGAYGALTLEAARVKARTWLELVARGIDPAEQIEAERRQRERARRVTFGAVIEDYIRLEVHGPGGETHPRQRAAAATVRILRDVLVPLFGHRPVTELTADELMRPIELVGQIGSDRALVKLKARKRLHRPGRKARPAPDQARALFAFAKMVLNWASEPDADYGLDRNPLDRVRKARRFGSPARRDRALSDEELSALTLAIERLPVPHRQAYQVLLHSGLRLNEVARARWSEIEAETWAIPASRMKGRNSGQGQARAHVVPLTPALRQMFDAIPRGKQGEYVFSVQSGAAPIAAGSARIKAALDSEMLAILRQRAAARGESPAKVALRPWRNHDVRRTCRSTLSRLRIDPDTAEAVLAHCRPGIKGVYDVWERYDEKREALFAWSKFLADLIRPQPISSAGRKRANLPA